MYVFSSVIGWSSYADGDSRSTKYETTLSEESRTGVAARARLNFWLRASDEAKFIRASIVPVENHPCPTSHPATSGGSNSTWFMLISAAREVSTEYPLQPTSFTARVTNSAGHEYRENHRLGSVNQGELKMYSTTAPIEVS